MKLKNSQKNNKLMRCFSYNNVHEINCDIKKVTCFYAKKDNFSLKALIKVSTFLELITGQRSFFIRSRKSLASLKLRRGVPLGAKVTLRKTALSLFLLKLIWQVLPNIKNFYNKLNLKKLKHKKINVLSITIPSVLSFSELQQFYFFFKAFNNLTILFSFSTTITKDEIYFSSRYNKLPF